MNAPLKNSIVAMTGELTEWRRDFHSHPELMYDLPRTSARVAELLRSFGFDEVVEGLGKTGVVGLLHGKSGPATSVDQRVLFRADMDALPIHEAGTTQYPSTTPGVMHACGHDGHTTILLGGARHLAETRDFEGTLVFCFQPAEEGGAGAQAMIDDGLLERYPVKGVYALHNWPNLPVGSFGVVRGPAMASANAFTLIVRGRGGHAAQPNMTHDPIVAAAQIVTSAQTIVSRRIDPLEPAVLSITAIHGGEAFNVISDTVEMRLTIRTFSDAVAETIERELRHICTHVGEAMGVSVDMVQRAGIPYPTTVNHPKETDIALEAMRAVAGADNVRDDYKPSMGSEDFSFLLRRVPGAYVFIGNGDSAPLHTAGYDFDDAVLPHGVSFWAELAARALPL